MAALPTPSIMATIFLLLLLLLIPTGSTSNADNDTAASASCDSSHLEKCRLVGEEIADSEFLMESEVGRILLDYNTFTGPKTGIPYRPVCGRPFRYQSCLGQKRQTPRPEKCDIFKRDC